jgi:inorganic triphosphatase YgiF
LQEKLANGPQPGAEIEAAAKAADIPERWLIAAASALRVRPQRGQWWLPG